MQGVLSAAAQTGQGVDHQRALVGFHFGQGLLQTRADRVLTRQTFIDVHRHQLGVIQGGPLAQLGFLHLDAHAIVNLALCAHSNVTRCLVHFPPLC